MERRREGESSSLVTREIKKPRVSSDSEAQSWESIQEIKSKNRISELKQLFHKITIENEGEDIDVVSSIKTLKKCDIGNTYREEVDECDRHSINIERGEIANIRSMLGEVNGWSYHNRAFGYLLLALKEKNKTLADFTLTDVEHFRVSDPARKQIKTLLGDNIELTFEANSEEFKTLADTEQGKVTSELVALYLRESGRKMEITNINTHKYTSNNGETFNFSFQIEELNN